MGWHITKQLTFSREHFAPSTAAVAAEQLTAGAGIERV